MKELQGHAFKENAYKALGESCVIFTRLCAVRCGFRNRCEGSCFSRKFGEQTPPSLTLKVLSGAALPSQGSHYCLDCPLAHAQLDLSPGDWLQKVY